MKHLLLPIFCTLLLSCSKDDGDVGDHPSINGSLPVKVTRNYPNGDIFSRSTFTYDSQKRRKTMRYEDQENAYTQTITYESGKIIDVFDYDAIGKPEEKHVHTYNANGVVKEEVYHNNTLFFIIDWFYRPDGGKEKRVKNAKGELVETWYYRFSSNGNIERTVLDHVSPALQDEEYIYSGFDNKQRVVNSYMFFGLPQVLLEVPDTKIILRNNQTEFIRKQLGTGAIVSNLKMKYTYNTKGQVTQTQIIQVNNNTLMYTDTIEYLDL